LEPKNQETKIVAGINRHLQTVLNRLVKKRLDVILGEVPVYKLIGETRAVESYREHTRALRALANDYVDNLVDQVRIFVLENGLSEVAIPDIQQSFSQDILGITFYGGFDALGGIARNLATLVRTGDCNLDLNLVTGALVVSGELGLKEIHLHWNRYDVEFQGIGVSGELTADVGRNSIFMQIEIFLTPNITITLDDFRIVEADDIDIAITGLGIFDWLVSLIISWVTDLFHEEILGLLESQLRSFIEEILPNLPLP